MYEFLDQRSGRRTGSGEGRAERGRDGEDVPFLADEEGAKFVVGILGIL